MRYVAQWQMQTAQMWLREDDAALGDVASRLGYESEAAVSRAFKRFIGVSPGAARRRVRSGHDAPVRRDRREAASCDQPRSSAVGP